MQVIETADHRYRQIEFDPSDSLSDIASVLTNKSVYNLIDMCNQLYRDCQDESERLKHMSIKDLAKDPKYKGMVEEAPEEVDKDFFDKYVKPHNDKEEKPKIKIQSKAAYIDRPLASMDGNIWIYPRSNGCLRVDFNDRSKAEAYLKMFRRKITSGDYSVYKFYEDLSIAIPLGIGDIAMKYKWKRTFNHELTWLSKEANKSIDTGQFGFCITKRASKNIGDKE